MVSTVSKHPSDTVDTNRSSTPIPSHLLKVSLMATTNELREQIIELLLKFEPETEDEECPFDAFLLQAKHYAEYARRAVAEAKRIRKRLREDAMFAELEQIRADDVVGMLKPSNGSSAWICQLILPVF